MHHLLPMARFSCITSYLTLQLIFRNHLAATSWPPHCHLLIRFLCQNPIIPHIIAITLGSCFRPTSISAIIQRYGMPERLLISKYHFCSNATIYANATTTSSSMTTFTGIHSLPPILIMHKFMMSYSRVKQ